MVADYRTVQAETTLDRLRTIMRENPSAELYVVDLDGKVTGLVDLAAVGTALFEPGLDPRVVVADLARPVPDAIEASDTFDAAIRRLREAAVEHLPVVADRESRVMVGVVHLRDAVQAHNRLLLAARAEEHGERQG